MLVPWLLRHSGTFCATISSFCSIREVLQRSGSGHDRRFVLGVAVANPPKVSRCWAYRPSDDPWKLPVCDDDGNLEPALVSAAAAALSPGGFRGQKVKLPSDAVSGVKGFLRRSWKKAYPDKDADDMPESIQASEFGDWLDGMNMDYYGHPKLDKTDSRVNYRQSFALPVDNPMDAPNGCHNCRFYEWGSCGIIEGTVEANGVSDMWTALPQVSLYMTEAGRAFSLHDLVAQGRSWALFNERAFAEAPDWIQYFPAPGVFNHPEYGAIVITNERNQRMLDNFKSGVYQEMLPVDVEHDLQLSGAVGWIDDMRMAGDGSLEAHVDWTDKGLELFDQDRFRYFSPSVMPEWPHTVSGETIQDVAIGGALCTRPYFKDRYLRPLVASEGGSLTALDKGAASARRIVMGNETPTTQAPVVVDESTPTTAAPEPAPYEDLAGTTTPAPEAAPAGEGVASFALTAKDAREFAEFQQAGGAAAVKALQGKVASLEGAARKERFTQMVTGRAGGDDGAPWVGNAEENVAMLLDLAQSFGEESPRFKAYVQRERGLAQQQRQSNLFTEVGSGGNPVDGSPLSIMEGLIIQKMAEAKVERGVATAMVAAERPELYDAYRKQSFADIKSE